MAPVKLAALVVAAVLWVQAAGVLARSVPGGSQDSNSTMSACTGAFYGLSLTKPAHADGQPAIQLVPGQDSSIQALSDCSALPQSRPGGEAGPNGIDYHGGPLYRGPVNVYIIWYGAWADEAKTIITDLIQTIGGSPYYNIQTSYTGSDGILLSSSVKLAGWTTDNYSRGKALAEGDIWTIASNAISSNSLPKDSNGLYFVLTAEDVTLSDGFCTKYCGWHTYNQLGGTSIKYSFVGNPGQQCIGKCAATPNRQVSPNGNLGADAMASTIIHELEEAHTDSELNGWYFESGNENADQCAWKFGNTYKTSNGATANVRLGSRDFLIQQNWVNANGGYCGLSYDRPS